jgi:prevent-host-death family protein
MAQYNVHEARSNLSQLLDMAERGDEVIIARHGKPVARLVPVAHRKSILGAGVGDPNYRGHLLTEEEVFSPMTQEEVDAWIEGRE